MSYYVGNKKHHSMLQGIGEKVKFAAQVGGAIKTGFDIAKGAYSVFQAVSPYLAGAALLL
jgi:hypothetical protein